MLFDVCISSRQSEVFSPIESVRVLYQQKNECLSLCERPPKEFVDLAMLDF